MKTQSCYVHLERDSNKSSKCIHHHHHHFLIARGIFRFGVSVTTRSDTKLTILQQLEKAFWLHHSEEFYWGRKADKVTGARTDSILLTLFAWCCVGKRHESRRVNYGRRVGGGWIIMGKWWIMVEKGLVMVGEGRPWWDQGWPWYVKEAEGLIKEIERLVIVGRGRKWDRHSRKRLVMIEGLAIVRKVKGY